LAPLHWSTTELYAALQGILAAVPAGKVTTLTLATTAYTEKYANWKRKSKI